MYQRGLYHKLSIIIITSTARSSVLLVLHRQATPIQTLEFGLQSLRGLLQGRPPAALPPVRVIAGRVPLVAGSRSRTAPALYLTPQALHRLAKSGTVSVVPLPPASAAAGGGVRAQPLRQSTEAPRPQFAQLHMNGVESELVRWQGYGRYAPLPGVTLLLALLWQKGASTPTPPLACSSTAGDIRGTRGYPAVRVREWRGIGRPHGFLLRGGEEGGGGLGEIGRESAGSEKGQTRGGVAMPTRMQR